MPGDRFIYRGVIGQVEQNVVPVPPVDYAAWRRRIDEMAAVLGNQPRPPRTKVKKNPQPKQPRALPGGRLKNVKLGDIIKAYEKRDGRRNRYVMIDFRPPRVGEYYLDRNFSVQRVFDRDDLADLKGGLRIILEFVKAEPREEY